METGCEVRVLGPVEVWRDGSRLQLSGRLQRNLLSLLVLAGDRVTTLDRLIDELWPGSGPVAARNAVHRHVGRLRSALAAGGGERDQLVATVPSGYLLRAEAERVDLWRFRALARSGHDALAADEPARAAGLLAQALGLWRGPAFTGASTPAVDQAVVALDEERLAAVEDGIEANLLLGEHHRLLSELSLLIAQYPLRERLRAAHLVALYRSGRQGEAFAAYQEARRVFVDELGIEPSARLRQLHEQLLAGGPAGPARLTVAGASLPAPAAPSAPAQLPAAPGDFIGRSAQVRLVRSLLAPEQPQSSVSVVVITGTGGVGKSALAAQAAHLAAGRFEDGQIYVDLHGATAGMVPLGPGEVLGRFLRSLGVPAAEVPPSVDEAAARFRSLVAHRALLIVLDGATSHGQVRPLIPASPRSAVVVTSRRPLTALDGAAHVHVGVLPPADSVALLTRIVGRSRMEAEPRAGFDLAAQCGHLPLALRIAAARLVAHPDWPVARLVELLADQQHRLDELQVADVSVRATLQVSYEALLASNDPDDLAAAHAFCLLGLPDCSDIDAAALARLTDRPQPEAAAILVRLAVNRLVESRGAGRYVLHDLLRLYSRELALHHPDHAEALHRLWRWQLAIARQAGQLLTPVARASAHHDNPDPDTDLDTGGLTLSTRAEALDWMEAEHANLLATVRQSAVVNPALAVELAGTLYAFCNATGRWHELAEANRVAIDAAQLSGDRRDLGRALTDAAVAHLQMRRFDQAQGYFERSLVIWQELGDPWGEAVALSSLGALHGELGHYETAHAHLRRSLDLRRALGDQSGVYIALANLGENHRRMGDLDAASGRFEQALPLAEAAHDAKAVAAILNNLGDVHRQRGDLQRSCRCLERSLAVRLEIRDRGGEAHTRANLGGVYRRLGCLDQAREELELAVRLGTEVEHHRAIDTALDELGMVHFALGQPSRAIACLRQARDRCRAGRDPIAEAGVLLHLATVQQATGDLTGATESVVRSGELSAQAGNRLGEAHAARMRGDLANLTEGPAAAAVHWRRALDLFSTVGTPHAAEVRELLLAAGQPL